MSGRAILRPPRDGDYAFVIAHINDWWGGREMAPMLPPLFFEYLGDTALIAEDDGRIVGFLAGFCSTSKPGEAYIHFVGVDPDARGRGLGGELYERFFDLVRARGCTQVNAVTAPINGRSIEFHQAMGFETVPGDAEVDGLPVHTDHGGPGFDVVVFRKKI
jgi:GNAT superfamily N-acetyltransferase